MLTPSAPLVLDCLELSTRYLDVRKLIRSHPAFRAAVVAGAPWEDLLHDVFLRLLAKQRGRSRWDPTRSGLSKYVWVVT